MAIRDYRPETRAPEGVGTPELSLERAGNSRGQQVLGGAVADYGTMIENARQETEANAARLTLTEGMGALNKELAGDTDAATMMDRYGKRLSELSAGVMGGLSTPRLKSAMGLEVGQAKVAAEARVFTRQRELAGSQARATLSTQLRMSANDMPNAATEAEARVIYDRANASIASLESAGYLTPEQGEQLRTGYDGDVAEANVMQASASDPAAALDTLQEPGAFGLDEVPRQTWIARLTRMTEQQAEQGAAKLDRRLQTAKDVLVRGGTVDPDDLATLQADIAGTPGETQLAGALAASQRLGGFAASAPDARAAEIERVRAGGQNLDEAPTDAAELRALEDIDAATRAAVERDPVAYAIAQGFEGAAPLDLGDPASLEDRMALVSYLGAKHGAPIRIFTDAEKGQYETALNEGSTEDQLAIVASVVSGMPANAATVVFSELGGVKPTVRMAGELVLDTGRSDVAAAILAGQKAIEEGDEARVPSADALTIWEEGLDGTTELVPGRRERVIAGAKAYYAAKAPSRGIGQDDVDRQAELLAEGVQMVLGAVEENGRKYGGVQSVNGRDVKLPPTLDSAAVGSVLNSGDADVWRAGSLTGDLPRWGMGQSEDWTETVPDDAQLQWVSGSIYRVGRPSRRGSFELFRDPGVEGGYFYVDLAKMAEAHMRQPRPASPARPAEVPVGRGGPGAPR